MIRFLTATVLLVTLPLATLRADEPRKEKPKPVAGKSELLRFIPKVFATLQKADAAGHKVTMLVEGDQAPTTWTLNPDAELKIHGWWARLDQFKLGDRVWVWFDLDRKHRKKSILLLADELSQQDISGTPSTVEATDTQAGTVRVKELKGSGRTLRLPSKDGLPQLTKGDKVFLQSAGDSLKAVVDASGLEKLRREQRLLLRKRWEQEGLPGTVTFLHPLSGELEIMLDHEAIRWGRNLKEGDRVTLREGGRVAADVQSARPWRERTLVRLVLGGFDQAEFQLGQRVHLLVPTLPQEADLAELPPDIDRPRSKQERMDWFLASTYCTCAVGNNTCTGMFYTLASCNVNACGMPNHIRDTVAELIDKGLSNRQIWNELKQSQGPLMLKPHLLP